MKITQFPATGEGLRGLIRKKGCILSSNQSETDEILMHRFQKGDLEAYEQLVLQNMGFVMRIAMRYLPDPASAEDISQQVFLRIWQSRDQFRVFRSFSGWISTITRNLALNEIRTRKRKNWIPRSSLSSADSALEAGEDWLGGTERFADPSKQLELQEQLKALREAMDQLPQNEHDAIYLQNIEGWDLESISRHLGISVPATKSLMFRVRKKLSKMLSLKDTPSEEIQSNPTGRELP